MKTLKTFVLITFAIVLNSCNSTSKFPISNVTPAAEITVKKSTDDQKNFVLEINANHLAEAKRLNPAGNNYSVWIVTKEHGIKNVGQLNVENGKKAAFKATSPFDFDETFITVENRSDLEAPEGVEITRRRL